MITIEPLEENIVKIIPSGKIREGDIVHLTPQIDMLIAKHGRLKLLVDGTSFEGWNDMHAAKKHFTFIRDHQRKVDRIAIVAGQAWQHWIAGVASVFVHPDIKVFDKGQMTEAMEWLRKAVV